MKKPYRLLYNHDGGAMVAPFQPFFDLPFSIDNFVAKTVGHLQETQVDAVTWTLGTDNQRISAQQGPGRASNLYSHATDVGERFYDIEPPFKSKFWLLHAERARQMIEAGADPPRVVVEQGHRSGLDVLIGFRMNDLHDSRLLWRGNPALMWLNRPLRHPVLQDGRLIEDNIVGYICRMKRDHPELLIGEHQGIGTAAARTQLPARLTEQRPVVLQVAVADDCAAAQREIRAVTVTLRLSFRDLTGGDHRIGALLNGNALPGFALHDDYPITYTRETSIPPHLLKPGENLLSLSVHRGDPRVISELWVEDVELMVSYSG